MSTFRRLFYPVGIIIVPMLIYICILLAAVFLVASLAWSLNKVDKFVDSYKGHDLAVYILYHDDKSEDVASRFFRKYKWAQFHKLADSKYLESSMLLELDKNNSHWSVADYVGFIVYNILNKQVVKDFDIEDIIAASKDADVISFYKRITDDMLESSTQYHPQFTTIWTKMLVKMGYSEEDALSPTPLYPCNCWISKPAFMKDYIEFAKRAMRILESDSELKTLCAMNSNYNGKLTKERLREIFGVEWYMYHPFIFERLPWFYAKIKGARVYGVDVGAETKIYPSRHK
jgi:hypothetical protein